MFYVLFILYQILYQLFILVYLCIMIFILFILVYLCIIRYIVSTTKTHGDYVRRWIIIIITTKINRKRRNFFKMGIYNESDEYILYKL